MKKHNEIYLNSRTLTRWDLQFARHLTTIITTVLEDLAFERPESEDGYLEDAMKPDDYEKAVAVARRYFEQFDTATLMKHKIEKSEDDFQALIGLNLKIYRQINDEWLKVGSF